MTPVDKQPFDRDDMTRRRRRSLVMALALGVMVILFFATTIVRLGGQHPMVGG